jgi:hypothetical protein
VTVTPDNAGNNPEVNDGNIIMRHHNALQQQNHVGHYNNHRKNLIAVDDFNSWKVAKTFNVAMNFSNYMLGKKCVG